MKATAAVFRGVGMPIELMNWPLPEPAAGGVLVEVVACTLCGSDLHSIHGRRTVPTPSVLGHEILGRIAAFGPGHGPVDRAGVPLAVGDRVTWAIVASCGACFFCERTDFTFRLTRSSFLCVCPGRSEARFAFFALARFFLLFS